MPLISRCVSELITPARSELNGPLSAEIVPEAMELEAWLTLVLSVEYLRQVRVLVSREVVVTPSPVHFMSMVIGSGKPPPPPYALIDNEHTLLEASDLVFIDPVGTGYSRVAEGEKVAEFHEYQRDLDAVGEFIRLYLTRYGRWGSPKYLIGERISIPDQKEMMWEKRRAG